VYPSRASRWCHPGQFPNSIIRLLQLNLEKDWAVLFKLSEINFLDALVSAFTNHLPGAKQFIRSSIMTTPSKRPVQGLNIVYTGNGKGKTTAAMGILLRAYGQGQSVGVIQFIKSPNRTYGEAAAALKLNIPFRSLGDGFIWQQSDQVESQHAAMNAWEEAQKWIVNQNFDLLILDEISYLFFFKWLDVNDAIGWIKQNKPPALHLVMTGRYAPPELIAFADLVTEMQEIKHPFHDQGISAQAGLDY
jgi:cob(I)alamin adenosyltransferase